MLENRPEPPLLKASLVTAQVIRAGANSHPQEVQNLIQAGIKFQDSLINRLHSLSSPGHLAAFLEGRHSDHQGTMGYFFLGALFLYVSKRSVGHNHQTNRLSSSSEGKIMKNAMLVFLFTKLQLVVATVPIANLC